MSFPLHGWVGCLGPSSSISVRGLVAPNARVHAGEGYALAAGGTAGEAVRLQAGADGAVRASIGDPEQGGSSVFISPHDGTVTLTRDPFGFHPAYYARIGQTLWFASDIRALWQLPAFPSKVNPQALHGYFCFSHVPLPLTTNQNIMALMPGERIEIRNGRVTARVDCAAWRERETLALTEEQAILEARELLRQGVAQRLGAESEVGVFLSGGLDSSLIAALLLEQGRSVKLYSLDFGAGYDNELEYAQRVAEHLGQKLTLVPAHPRNIRQALHQTAHALQQPFGDGVTVPLYLLGQAAAKEVSVVLNGEGGDQLFGGWALKPMLAAELYADTGYDRIETYMQTYHRFYTWTKSIYTARARAMVSHTDARAFVRPALETTGFCSLLHRLRAANLWLKGAQNIAPRATQLAMAHHLRIRAPFFDRALVEWTFSLTPELFLNGATEKYLLKRVAEPYLPPEVVWREKRGMRVPTTEWCLGPLRWEAWRELNPLRLRRQGWFETRPLLDLLMGNYPPAEFRSQRLGEKLWSLLFFQTWCRVHRREFAPAGKEVTDEMHLLRYGQ